VKGWVLLGMLLGAAGCASAPPPSHEIVHTRSEDTLLDIARDHDLGYREMIAANPGVDPWLPGEGTEVVVPRVHLSPEAPADGIVVNLAEQRLYFFPTGGGRVSYPIGIGRAGWPIPIGTTEVVEKQEAPTWYPTASARREDPTLPKSIPPGSENPLGTHALYLGWPRYLIHGTNEPYGVGRRVSRGCIRLYPEDILPLFEQVELGTPVRVINEPVKLGWLNDRLFIEAHPPLSQESETPPEEALQSTPTPELEARIAELAGDAGGEVDWERVAAALRERRGVPLAVTPAPAPNLWERIGALLRSNSEP
jgi:L,D-transpeptidase ErfK/SrfK